MGAGQAVGVGVSAGQLLNAVIDSIHELLGLSKGFFKKIQYGFRDRSLQYKPICPETVGLVLC